MKGVELGRPIGHMETKETDPAALEVEVRPARWPMMMYEKHSTPTFRRGGT